LRKATRSRSVIKSTGSMSDLYPSPGTLKKIVRQALPNSERCTTITELSGGNLNKVWRAVTEIGQSCILKHAPPFIASQPDIPLDDSRLLFESRILKRFRNDERLSGLQNACIQVPDFIHYHAGHHLLLMEDVGELPSLLKALSTPTENAKMMGQTLGRFIAELHLTTFQDPNYLKHFSNQPVQETRDQVQYQQCGNFCRKVDLDEDIAQSVEERCHALGKKLISPGYCLIMGDLWPESILVDSERLILIDWEMTHYGRPLQDIAHLDAHLWMMADRAPSESARIQINQFRATFINTYFVFFKQNEAFIAKMVHDEADYHTHFGAEILARTVGAFKGGYLYESYETKNPVIQKAVQKAVEHILYASDSETKK